MEDEEKLKKATTLTMLSWSLMTSVGSMLGGYLVSTIGIVGCYFIDSLTFVVSAYFLVIMGGHWDVSSIKSTESKEEIEIDIERNQGMKAKVTYLLETVWDMTVGGANYIRKSSFWPIVLIKASSSLIYGGADVLNVSFSENVQTNDTTTDNNNYFDEEAIHSRRLGLLFSGVGLGCLIGPFLADPFIKMKHPHTLLDACILAFLAQAIGCLGMGYFKESFYCTVIYTSIRSAGSMNAWMYSSLLLQIYSKPDMLGRVMAVDYALALTSEASSAMLAGTLLDLPQTPYQVSIVLSYIATFFFIVWVLYGIRRSQNTSTS